ncbi:MAG: FMN-dependent NADH-azoreductase [Alcanivoracaceae bacterium]|uniref:FMN-dependent NADH-azoreductase n=1 Tax=Alcanivorax sp. MD8A TaxID=1177157 RepID=UPI000C635090|nr:FMN-dependent NADH-azoreductase [Alcanivorax sp. MD8A]MAX56853.1 FMN-dependent NADH-azoreductase [Alcanivoracaceae bacterium]MCG8438120.1 FMN-dependent NADH-azoreductase [Pseudomonadales bacterium]MED5430701.1 FMN-dependent NADH-azoreductase [Pseudomonadota bacterium]MEE2869464.1 FMN-dependent NADH-azoreductase [Pseudomonadota bacterium]PNE03879.1 ACP phosphodieterase [Alcanivorax sp. MD8A]|tara:strand:+ start:3922 stop:4512 length:591 start_codon:yes stop_codon:yes gene_type:complete
MNILVIKSSVFGDNGNSSALVNTKVEQLKAANPGATVVVRDLSAQPIPHLDGERVGAFFTPAEERTAEQQQVDDFSLTLIEELKAADHVVLGLPMYNFGIPSQLKSWIDHVARAGITFRYTENGPQGLLEDKPVTVLAARGGLYAGTDNDTVTPYIKLFFGFVGITSVELVYAEGLNMGDEAKENAMKEAKSVIAG